jgi:hypothetical protein
MVPSSGEACVTWIRNLGRFSTCLDLLTELLARADFGQEAVQAGLLPGLLKAWPPQGYDQPQYFVVVQANEAMCECSANMLTAVELALRNGEFKEWKEKQRNELVEWLSILLTWQRLLGAYPDCATSQDFQGAIKQAWAGVYGDCLGAGSGIRTKLAKKMQKTFRELVASPEARTWSPTLQSTMKVVGEVIDEQMKERDGGGGTPTALVRPPEGGLPLQTSARGAPQVSPDKVAALLRSRKKADVLRGIQAIRAVLEGAMQVTGNRVALCRELGSGLPLERAGVWDAVMDAFEGPLGGWLLQANQKADAKTALTFLDSMCRRFLREVAATEAGKLSVRAEFPPSEYWRAKEAGQETDRALEAGNGEVRSVGGSSRNKAGSADRSLAGKRAIALPRGPTVSTPNLNGRKEEADGPRGTSDGCDGRNAGSDGRDRDSDGPNGSSDRQEVTSTVRTGCRTGGTGIRADRVAIRTGKSAFRTGLMVRQPWTRLCCASCGGLCGSPRWSPGFSPRRSRRSRSNAHVSPQPG